MRTGQEMYQFCKENKLGSSISKSWTIKHFDVVAKNLSVDEEVIMVFVGLHNHRSKEVTGGKDENDGFYGYVVTNKRLMYGQKKLFGEAYHVVMLEHLNDVSLKTGILAGEITIDSIKEKFVVYMSVKTEAQNVVQKLNDALLAFKASQNNSSAPAPTTPSSVDELRALKKLADDGIITAEEFDAKKKQLLGLI